MSHTDDEWTWLSLQPRTNQPPPSHEADTALAKCFTRTFEHDDGARVLAHLRSLTRERVLGPETPDSVLRHVEGQRGLVAYMERLIARGRAPEN